MNERDFTTSPWIVTSHSVDQTRLIAHDINQLIFPTAVVLLSGDLGAGKTTIIQAMLADLGYAGPVKSPTFDLVHLYECDRVTVYHVDLYRIQSLVELEVLDLPHDGGGRNVLLAEWGDALAGLYPDYFHLVCELCGPRCRRFSLTVHGDAYQSRWRQWRREMAQKEINS